jgi:hypothetical protein
MSDTEAKSAAPSPAEAKLASQLEFHFIRSPLFRSVPADGAWFNPDATGTIHMVFFNEYAAIPDRIIVNLDERGMFVSEGQRIAKQGMTRELEVDVVMNFADAAQFHATLGENLKQIKAVVDQSIPEEAKEIMRKAATQR